MGLRDDGQFRIKHTGKSEQAVALVLQCNSQGADTPHILGFAMRQFLDDEVEQHLPRG